MLVVGCCEGMMISGYAAFGPKVIETQFGLTAANAALLFGKKKFYVDLIF